MTARADALLPRDDARRVPLLHDVGDGPHLEEAVRVAEASGSRALTTWSRAAFAVERVDSGAPGSSWDDAVRAADEAIGAADGIPHPRGVVDVFYLRGILEELRGRLALANPWYAEGLRNAIEAGLVRDASSMRGLLAGTWLLGDTPAREAAARLRELLEAAPDTPIARLELVWRLGVFLLRMGEFDEGDRLVDVAERWVRELGATDIGDNFSWWVATWTDPWRLDAASWEADLRARVPDPLDPSSSMRTVTPSLAVALCEQGRFDEAEHLTAATADLAGGGHAATRGELGVAVTWRGARARALARLGRTSEAESLSLEALTSTEVTDRLDVRGEAAWHRADVLRALGRGGEADEALRVGIDAFERKGFGPSADKLRGLLAST